MNRTVAVPGLRLFTLALSLNFLGLGVAPAETGARTQLQGHVPSAVARLAAQGSLAQDKKLNLSIGLPLRNQAELAELLRQLQDPQSANFHKYLTPQEFTARFGPTEPQYKAVLQFAQANEFSVAGTHPNRVVLDVEASVGDIERTFQIALRTYQHPTEARLFYAPDREPSVPASVPIIDVWGLSDFAPPRPLVRPAKAPGPKPLSGSGPSGYYAGNDFRNAYVPGTTLTGAGQSVGLLEFSGYFGSDITNYENTIGMTSYVPLVTVVIGHPAPNTSNNIEVALDIEVAIAMARGLSQVIVYESAGSPSSILSKMATDNLAKQLSSSWSWGGGPSATIDSLYQQMAAQGQSMFQASGDSDAYTGSNTLDNPNAAVAPVDSTNLTCVGGTELVMNGAGASYASESVWNWHSFGGTDANVGSSGGISSYYTIPPWQVGISMANNSGSTVWRNIPDVALTADNVYVAYNNGSSGAVGGTSCAAPLWAGFCALVNQVATGSGGAPVGFLNPALYALAKSTNYNACFHDTTTGNNTGTGTAGLFNAVVGYDLCTGLGTPNGTNLINALVPSPSILSQPVSQSVGSGSTVSFSVTAGGQTPLHYQWRFDGTNLPAGGNVSGVTSNILTITSVTAANAGNYNVVVTNSYGSVTSSVAVLSVGVAPSISVQPTNVTVLLGGNASFATTVSGTAPLSYQWRQNGLSLVNGPGISGATSNVLTLSGVTAGSIGGYSLAVSNAFGATNSSVANLTVVSAPAITASTLADLTVQCGSNAVNFSVTASGTLPLSYQWSLDGSPLAGATTTALSLANVHLPNHTVSVVVTNLYGSVSSNALLTVQDTMAPVITLNGANPLYLTVGTSFTDPGATALDTCMGVVAVSVSGTVNTNAVGTNTLTYVAGDDNGNTNSVTRSVIVQANTASLSIANSTNSTVLLTLTGNPSATYILQIDTNLNITGGWVSLFTNTFGTNGVSYYSDPTSNRPQRYYRLNLPY